MATKRRGSLRGAPSPAPARDRRTLATTRTEDEGNGSASSLVVSERSYGRCPASACGAEFDVTPNPEGGWWIGSFSTRCPGGGDCLRAMAEAVGTTAGLLLEAPHRYLAPYLTGRGSSAAGRSSPREREITFAMWSGWRSRLLSTQDVCAYLERRGINPESGLGLAERAHGNRLWPSLAIPAEKEERRDQVTFRFLPPEPQSDGKPRKTDNMRGWRAGWTPDLPTTNYVLLLAGPLDAWIARQHGLRYAVSTDCGATLPAHLVDALAARQVAIAYDVGEDASALRTLARVSGVAAEAWVVSLADLGLPEGGDLNDYLAAGGTRRDVERLAQIPRRRRRLA